MNDIMGAIIGDMPQPDDADDYEIVKRDDGTYLVDAQIPFYDFLTRFDKTAWINEEEQAYDTLAGCILDELERIPQSGDKMAWKGFDFEIMDMDGHRIDKVLVTPSQEIMDEMEE
jgi:putative hemolysin